MWPLTQSYWRLEWTVLFGECQAPVDECDDCSDLPVTNVQFDMERFVADSNVTMHYVDLIVNDDNGETVEVQGSFDTGTQMSVIKEDLINPLQYEVLSEVKLLGFNDNMSTGKVISLFAKLNDQDLSVPIKFVACQHVTQNCLLSLADYRALLQNQEVRSTRGQTLGTPENTDNLPTSVGDLQQVPNEASYDVNTSIPTTAVLMSLKS